MNPTWQTLSFNDLTKQQLYDLLKLRQDVFVIEQTCIYPDLDEKDQRAFHVLGYVDDKLAAYARVFDAGDYFEAPSFGRITTAMDFRKQGLGKQLVEETLKSMKARWPGKAYKISAQCYLINFYREFGFEQKGEEYLEDGIPHVAMWFRP